MTSPDNSTSRPSLDELFSIPLEKSPAKPILPPINLPSFTFLIGSSKRCDLLSSALSLQSNMVYVDDLLLPYYDAVQALLSLPMQITPTEIREQHSAVLTAMKKSCSSFIDPVALLLSRWEDSRSFADYQFVCRDAEGFDLSPFTSKFRAVDILILHLDAPDTNFNSPPMRMFFSPTQSIDEIMEELRKTLT